MDRSRNSWKAKQADIHFESHNVHPGASSAKKRLSSQHGRRQGNRFRKEYARVYDTPRPIGGPEKANSEFIPRSRVIHHLEDSMLLAFERAERAKE